MSMTEVVEESLKADARFRHLTVMPSVDMDKLISDIESENYQDYWD